MHYAVSTPQIGERRRVGREGLVQKLTFDVLAQAPATKRRLREVCERVATFRFTGSALFLLLFLLAITTDAAGRFGLIPFALLLAVHLRRARGST